MISASFVTDSVRNDMRLFLRTKQYPVQLRTTKFLKSATPVLFCTTLQSTTPVLQSTNQVLLRATKYLLQYYKVLLQYYKVQVQ